jgi:hypothetical protein
MQIIKEHQEFHVVNLDHGWETPPGYPEGIKQQILAGVLDEKNRRGYRTRHLRFEPGAGYTTRTLQVRGRLPVARDASIRRERRVDEGMTVANGS